MIVSLELMGEETISGDTSQGDSLLKDGTCVFVVVSCLFNDPPSTSPCISFLSTSSFLNGLLLLERNGFEEWNGLKLLLFSTIKLIKGLDSVGDTLSSNELKFESVSFSTLSRLKGGLFFGSGVPKIRFSNFPSSELLKNVTVTGVAQRF